MEKIPIILESGLETNTYFTLLDVDKKQNLCNVKWPNGYIDRNVPLTQFNGTCAVIPDSELQRYLEPDPVLEKLGKTVQLLKDLKKPQKLSIEEIDAWCKPPTHGGLRILELRRRAMDLGIDVAGLKKEEIKKRLIAEFKD